MPPSSAAKTHQPISHSSTITFALGGGLLVTAALCVAAFVSNQADVRYQGRDIEQLKAAKKQDDDERQEMKSQLRILMDRSAQQKQQLDRIEGKLDTYFSQPVPTPSVRRASTNPP